MKKFAVAIFILILQIAPPCVADTRVPRISLVEGDVMIATPETGEWAPASINTPVHEGDSIWCPPKARVELQLANGSRMRLNSNSQLNMLTSDDNYVQIHLSRGQMFVRTTATKEQNLQIDVDDTTVLPFARTRLRIDMKENGDEDVSIFKGAAYVEGNGSRTKVRAGEQLLLEDGRNELLALDPPDEWEKWNAGLDKDMNAKYASASHLPEEIRMYAGDLDANGSWVTLEGYGAVWRPALSIRIDWAPYRDGRWVWINGGYVWVSYEKWGWVPYHYGRWIFYLNYGWCWIPPQRDDVYWGPGYVAWFYSGQTVAWVPLAPGEIYFGHGYYGRHSIDVSRNKASNVQATGVFKNLKAPGAATVIQRKDFSAGIPAAKPARAKQFPTFKQAIPGPPAIAPTRESRMPVVKSVPAYKATPPVKTAVEPKHAQQRFPRIKAEPLPTTYQRTTTSTPSKTSPPLPSGSTAATSKKQTVPAVSPSGVKQASSPSQSKTSVAKPAPSSVTITRQQETTAPSLPGVAVPARQPDTQASGQPKQSHQSEHVRKQEHQAPPASIRGQKKVWKVITKDDKP